MGTFVDSVMLILFVLFMIFIQRGYHHKKSLERKEQEKLDKEKESQSSKKL